MANQYIPFRERDHGAGLDQESAENNIQPGFAEDIQNMDPQANGHIITRKGYQGYLGYMPIRVESIDYTTDATNNICLTLPEGIDLSTIAKTPLILQGKTSDQNSSNLGDFPNNTDSVKYFPTFTTDFRKIFSTGTNVLALPSSQHTHATEYMFVQTSQLTSQLDNSNSLIYADKIEIDTATYNIDVTYTNGTGSDFEGIIYTLDNSSSIGTAYVTAGNTVNAGATTTVSINAATHALDTFSILTRVYEETTGLLTEVNPDSVVITNAGTVEVTITNSTIAAIDYTILLRAVPVANVQTGTIASGSTNVITVLNLPSHFIFADIVLEVGTNLEKIIPGSITVDASTNSATFTFTNSSSSGTNFRIFYETGSLVTNRLCLNGTVIGSAFMDTRPQLTLWGLKQSELYPTSEEREGWVTLIDSYRSVGEDRIITGLGGNIFRAALRTEDSNTTDYLMPQLYPYINGRVSGDFVIGPVFYDTTDSPLRTRGFIKATNASTGYVTVSSATYQSGTGYTRYRLLTPGQVIGGTISTIIAVNIDRLTIQQMGYSKLNGTFTVRAVTAGADYIDIDVTNNQVVNDDTDELDAGGLGGIFTDQITLTASAVFLPDDLISDSGLTVFNQQPVNYVSGTTVGISSVIEQTLVPSGLRLSGMRQTNIIRLRDIDNNNTVANFLKGDMVSYSSLTRALRISYVRSASDISITIAADGTTGTITLGSGDTSDLEVGQTILINGTIDYDGSQIITAIPNLATVEFSTSLTSSVSGTLVGKTIELDETLEIQDEINSSNFFTLIGRFVPVEAPSDSFDLTPKTYIQYLDSNDYNNQPTIRSVMVQDNLYFTNGDDEVMKFDGSNIYRAGLFRWQPHLFVTTNTGASAKIVTGNPSISYTASAANYFTVADADRLVFQVGDEIADNDDAAKYTVVSTQDDGTNSHIYVNRTVTGGAGSTLTKVSNYSYYFRLNAVDANENVVASAVTGSNDFIISLDLDAAVSIRLVGMPAWHIYDYNRIEVQIYRTKANQSVFYRLTTLALPFNSDDGYVDYTDTASDEDLVTLDEVSSSLYGAELATTLSEPIRAKYITSADNRLILSNLKDYPTIDLRMIQNNQGPITISDLVLSGNDRYLFRIDNTDTGTTTNMLSRVAYQFRDSTSAQTITGITGTLGTSFSVASTSHGITTAGQWVYLYHPAVSSGNSLTYTGWYQVSSVTNANAFVIKSANAEAGAASNFPTRFVKAAAPADVPVFLGTDGNYAMRNGNRTSTEPYEFLAIRRLANAINASMRNVDITITGYETFSPWIIGNAGNEFNIGQLIVRQPKVINTNLELQLPALTGAFDVFGNSVKRLASQSIGQITRLFPSRTIQSFTNYPELFDAPTVIQDTDSLSAVDVNSADGQEVTSVIPFFGSSAFGASQQNSIVVVFKENSIYLQNTSAKEAGEPAIQKLETDNKGCTAPYSVATTNAGIMFANFTGIYRLGRDLKIDYVGRKYERTWLNQVDRNQLSLATGHNFSNGNQYKLSLPVRVNNASVSENNQVFVYNHTRELVSMGPGSWTRYTNHPVTGYCNLLDDAFFGTTKGEVFSIRRAGDLTDYRDDAEGIDFSLLARAMDFGDSSIRKVFGDVISHFRTFSGDISSVSLLAGVNLVSTLQETDAFTITNGDPDNTINNLSDTITRKISSLRTSLPIRVGNYLQLQYKGNIKDNPLELAGIDIRVAAKSVEGITEAAET